MASEGRVFHGNLILDAAITHDDEDAAYPVSRIKNGMPSVTSRSQGIAEITIVFDFGVATNIEGVWIGNHNIVSGDTTYKWESSTDNFSSTEETEDLVLVTRTVKGKNTNGTIVDLTRRDAHYQAAWNRRYYQLRIQKASGSYIEIGEVYIMAGNYLFDLNYIWGYSSGREHVFNEIPTPFGQVHRVRKYSREVGELTFQQLGDTQKEAFDEEIGENEKVVFINGISGHHYYGSFAFSPPSHQFTDNWYHSATFTEHL
jgi:hypothetical protein